jgi:hypothetical protein
MTGEVKKIHQIKVSSNGNLYRRIEFLLDNGNWAKTDICPDYRNYKNWAGVLQHGEGITVSGLRIRRTHEVDGDSTPTLITNSL